MIKADIQKIWRKNKLQLICSSLLLMAIGFPLSGRAAIVAQLNPRPGIFNEPPYNHVPRTAPAAPALPAVIPSPGVSPQLEPEPTPDAVVVLASGKVSIRLVNQTGAVVDYQAIGDTQARTLAGQTEITLKDLSVPVTLTFRRQDSGLLQVTLQPNSIGILDVTLNATTNLGVDRTTLTIDQTGSAFLN
jgi:hypothetical protein